MTKMNMALMSAAIALAASGGFAQAEPAPKSNTPQPTRRSYNSKTRQHELVPDPERQHAAEEKRKRKAAKRLAKEQLNEL